MNHQLFSVFDSAVQAFAEPFFAPSIEFAIRAFREAVNGEDTQVGKFPDDYTLFHVGTFHVTTGELFAIIPPLSLGVAITFVDRKGDF